MKRFWISFILVCIGQLTILSVNISQNNEIKMLKKQRDILIDNYLSNIDKYRKPLWINEKDKKEFIEWLEETSAR